MKHSITLLLLMMLCWMSASARMPKALQRYQLGYSYAMMSAEYRLSYPVYRQSGNDLFIIDTVLKKDIRTKGGFGATMGTYIPIAKLSENAVVALGIDGVFNMLVWDYERVKEDYGATAGYSANYAVTGGTMQMGVPIGFDMKFGCDAALDKSRRSCATFGVGAFPSASLTAYEMEADAAIKVQPYFKAEVGFFAGVCFKVRALYTPGKIGLIDQEYNSITPFGDVNSNISLTGRSSFTFSLLVMPFSFAWERSEWWGR